MSITGIAFLSVTGVIVLALLKSTSSVTAIVVRIAIVVAIVVSAVPQIKELISLVDSFGFFDNVSQEAFKVMIKVFSILVISSVVSDVCRDNGENGIAGVVELSAKIIAVSVSVPVITSVISVATSFFNR